MKHRTPRVLSQQAQDIIADVYLVGSVPADPPLVSDVRGCPSMRNTRSVR